MRMRTSLAAVVALAALAGTKGVAAPDAAGPLIDAVSPAATHAGASLLLTARHLGRGRPRVFVGARRVRPRDVRVEPATDDGTQRVWARVPKRSEIGSHEVRLATRAGTAVAAKPIVVVSCNPAPALPFDCGTLPKKEHGKFTVKGAGGFQQKLESDDVRVESMFGQTVLTLLGKSGTAGAEVSLNIFAKTEDLAVGSYATVYLTYMDPGHEEWSRIPGAAVDVVEAAPHRVSICIDATLPATTGQDPGEVTLQGYFVFDR